MLPFISNNSRSNFLCFELQNTLGCHDLQSRSSWKTDKREIVSSRSEVYRSVLIFSELVTSLRFCLKLCILSLTKKTKKNTPAQWPNFTYMFRSS